MLCQGPSDNQSSCLINLCVMLCVDCSWDEWVPESRVLKLTDASRQKQKELQNAHMYDAAKHLHA